MFKMRALFVWALPVMLAVPAVTQAETYFGYTSMGTSADVASTATVYTATGSRIYAGMAWPVGKVFVTGAEVATLDMGKFDLGSGVSITGTGTAVNWVIGPRMGNFGLDLGVGSVAWSETATGSAAETGSTTSTFVNLKYRVFKKLSVRYEIVNFTTATSNGDVKIGMSGLGLSLDF